MSWLRAYGCVSAAGATADALSEALFQGRDNSAPWTDGAGVRAFLFAERREATVRELLGNRLTEAFAAVASQLVAGESLGVIFASTKGFSNDFIWQAENPAGFEDPLTPLLRDFLHRTELQVERQLVVSNACSSALAALALGQGWLRSGLDQVLILSADAVTPFVLRGFQALRLISNEGVRPFAPNRSGFYLGEAAACLLLSRTPSELFLYPVGLDTEGTAVTRPSSSSESLRRAAGRIGGPPPEVVVAHGTATPINDETEDLAFASLFPHRPWITATKWCIGHTLAVSGALDLIAAAEMLRQQVVFRLHTTETVDPKFTGKYFSRGATRAAQEFSRVQLTALGFGGMHASALLERSRP